MKYEDYLAILILVFLISVLITCRKYRNKNIYKAKQTIGNNNIISGGVNQVVSFSRKDTKTTTTSNNDISINKDTNTNDTHFILLTESHSNSDVSGGYEHTKQNTNDYTGHGGNFSGSGAKGSWDDNYSHSSSSYDSSSSSDTSPSSSSNDW